jgi:hypothetical protein
MLRGAEVDADVVVVAVTVIVLYEVVAVIHERARRRFSA